MVSLTKYYGDNRKLFDTNKIKRGIAKVLDESAKKVKSEFEKTVDTWDEKPVFTIDQEREDTRIISTTNPIYSYVTHGTRPHVIRHVNAPRLAFPVDYRAKTAVNVIGSTQGGASGGLAFAREVQHPGTKARNFEQVISKAIQPKIVRSFDKIFQDAMK